MNGDEVFAVEEKGLSSLVSQTERIPKTKPSHSFVESQFYFSPRVKGKPFFVLVLCKAGGLVSILLVIILSLGLLGKLSHEYSF